MTENLYDGMIDAWKGELFGAALMRALRTRLSDAAEHALELDTIERVETLMARALERVVDCADLRIAASSDAAKQAAAVVQVLDRWDDLLALTHGRLEIALDTFRALPHPSDRRGAHVLDLLIAHEEALIAFFKLSQNGVAGPDNQAMALIEANLVGFLKI